MTRYLLDANVVQEMHPKGNAQVRAWLASVGDHQLYLSAIMFLERRKGLERERMRREKGGKDAADVLAEHAKLDALAAAYADRIVPVDEAVAQDWGRLLAISEKHDRDTAYAASARINDLVLVTRNVKHVVGRNVQVVDPFAKEPEIKTV